MAPTPALHNQNNLITRDTSTSTSLPQAPPAVSGSWGASNIDGWSPSAIIGIVAAIVIILVFVPLIAVILRRYERKRCLEMLPDSASAGIGSSKNSVREDQSLKSILVTKEVLRSSLRVGEGLRKPEEAHTNGRGWSRTEKLSLLLDYPQTPLESRLKRNKHAPSKVNMPTNPLSPTKNGKSGGASQLEDFIRRANTAKIGTKEPSGTDQETWELTGCKKEQEAATAREAKEQKEAIDQER
ncbi:hypothetical protein CC86DRAFT_406910 [Ophiobolus disseminans]|uniref:Uncharacterized protein n=1 Tax=Ophiobolus disseminans TaxID=1469910 RepID=A0A6A6ZY68_9PLEO|nr:hypothetical protein CC86DRAFT_406910 [Ophiobolus disseminans]